MKSVLLVSSSSDEGDLCEDGGDGETCSGRYCLFVYPKGDPRQDHQSHTRQVHRHYVHRQLPRQSHLHAQSGVMSV